MQLFEHHMTERGAVLHLGDCVAYMEQHIEADSIDAIVTDPPYGLSAPPDIAALLTAWLSGDEHNHSSAGFMGKAWDSMVPSPRAFRAMWRALKPGGHAVVFAGTRTVDLMGISARLGGFEVRDVVHWGYF
jgi:site-specific DNA-methyltransferase (adenine-specific)